MEGWGVRISSRRTNNLGPGCSMRQCLAYEPDAGLELLNICKVCSSLRLN